ncbi:MotA/TolQ/ExbB proton channel family protein [Psychrobacter sp. I-STPA10]|uniref:MotA/TolQ/ExbB proton channel family protein n=1 Tax=Psychrobacter sp. I-STPA10 TaxID=2585769 RepID=UPI001E39961F|nr:MotA/TolQ/ExbB proton channel family protein [Psychrobacter sp. I-STPA10]
MWELIRAGGWLMAPIVLCSVLALIIIIERSMKLQYDRIVPKRLREQLINRLRENGDISRTQLMNVKEKTPLGDILATGLLYRQYGLDSMTMHMQNRASVQIHQLEKNINMLGTIGAISPLLGLLGTVLGIIASFLAITDGAMQDPTLLAAGVSQALITTAAGMIVAIPALVAYRFFQRRIVDINAEFETQAGLMIQEMYDYQLFPKVVNECGAGLSLATTDSSTEISLDEADKK